jgi:magnesium transporter
MAVGDLELRDWARVLWREVRTGLVLGAVLGLMGVVRAVLWGTGGHIAMVVGLTFVGVVFWGAVVGALFPLGLRRIGLDPATASSPFVASVVDVIGIVVYFNIARVVLF